MRGHVDVFKADNISGWVMNPAKPDKRVQVRLQVGKDTLASITASSHRKDVGDVMKTDGNHGFSFPKSSLITINSKQFKSIKIQAEDINGNWIDLRAPEETKRVAIPQYQSFDDAVGSSKSAAKLAALRLSTLPNGHSTSTPLRGLSVLDLGCNEGFFCGEALKQGAKRVVGIDANREYVERARKRFSDAEFKQGSWWEIPNEKFDVIFFLSAIHYEWEQRAFLDKLSTHLTPTGTLVLECGIGHTSDSNWHVIQRGDGIMRYPNFKTLSNELLQSYAWRYCGASVEQVGDPVSRSVLHCQKKRPAVILVTGPSGSGKSILSLDLKQKGLSTFQIDGFLKDILESSRYNWSPVANTVKAARDNGDINCRALVNAIVAANQANAFTDLIMLEAFLETDILVIEGEALEQPAIRESLTEKLKSKNIKVWAASPG